MVGFGKNIEINTNKPLPHLDVGSIPAFSATQTIGKDKINCYALICNQAYVPRRNSAFIYQGLVKSALNPLISHGVCSLGEGKQNYVFVYENNITGSITADHDDICLGWKPDKVIDVVFRSLVDIFKLFQDNKFFHGNIRPSNMFFSKKDKGRVILGDCLCTPASSMQPAIIEPIERAMAEPLARGDGDICDDIYAFGASLALIMRAHDEEFLGKSDEEIIREKIEKGSYATLTGKMRFSGPIHDLLKGLLHDDGKQRWGIQEIITWADGKRPGACQPINRKKADRGLNFSGKNYSHAYGLALDIGGSPKALVEIVENGKLEQWISRNLGNKHLLERYHTALKHAKSHRKGSGFEESLVSDIRSALMPEWPVIYGGRCFSYKGMSTALAYAFANEGDLKIFHEMFDRGVFLNWLHMQGAEKKLFANWLKLFDNCRVYIKDTRSGYGLERCLYMLNGDVNCLSPKLEGYFVTEPEQMLNAFEEIALTNHMGGLFMDRHSTAFLSVLDGRSIEGCLYDLGSSEKHRQIMGNLRCLSNIQSRYKMQSLPNLSKAFINNLQPVYARFHDRTIRKNIEDRVAKSAKNGDLKAMVSILDNNEAVKSDMDNFKRAMQEYQNLSLEYKSLSKKLKNQNIFALREAHEFSAIVSAVIALLFIAITTLLYFSRGELF